MNNLTINDFFKIFALFYEAEYGIMAREEIIKLGIEKVIINNDLIEIHLERPGLLIGKKCSNINKLNSIFEGYNINIKEIDTFQSKILAYLNDKCSSCGKILTKDTILKNKQDNFCSYLCASDYNYLYLDK